MAIEKLVPQYLNQDEDERLVKPFEMIDALNVRVANEDEGNQGILKNIDGTTAVIARSTADAIPASGTNRIIGAVSSDASKCVYYFLYNSEGNHGIYRYNISSENYQQLYEDSVLNFEYNGFVKADVVINQYQEDLLYFTDNRNEPRKINATRAGLNQYDDEFNTGSDYVKNLYLTACKRPPQEPITFGFVNDNDLLVNNLKESCFQFACQYVYDDGEVSAIGVYSSLAVSPTHLAYNTTTQTFFQNNNNAIDLTIPNSDGPVEKIKILARKNNAGAFYQIGEIPNTNSATQVFRWTNDGVYPLVPDTEANKMYDALPRQAGTQTITNNRLLYGNYVEGFDPIEPDTAMYPVYHLGGQEDISNFTGFLRDSVVEDRDDFTTKRYFGDVPARFGNECTDGFSDGSSGVEEINPTYNSSAYIDQYPIEIDLSEAEESGQNSSFAYYFDLSISEIAWFPSEGGSFTNSGDYVTRPVSVVDEDGNPETLSPYTAGLRLGFPAEVDDNLTLLTGSDSYKNNYNAGVRNLRPENNLIFSGTVDVDSWTSRADLGVQLINGIVGQTATIAVSPNILNNSEGLAEGTFLAGSTTEARILNSDGGVPALYGNCTDSLTNAYGVSSKLFLWMAGSVDISIDYGYYTGQKIRFKLRRTGFNLSTVATKAVWNGTQTAGFVRAHPFIWNARNFGEFDSTTGLIFNGQTASSGSYDTVVWDGDTMLIDYSSNNNYNNAQYIGGAPVNGTDGSILGGGSIRTVVRGLTADIRLSQDIRLDSASSFKAGARHDFGLVYFDSRNRPSPVYKLGSVNTSRFGDRGGNRNGRTEIDIKLFHEPPDYAAYWAPVYTKNTTYETFLQVTVAEAALPRKTSFINVLSGNASGGTQRVISGLKTSIDETIFLSMRTLEGKNNSYKELKGGLIDYKYQEGDKLRVIQYQDGSTINRPYHEFVITGYNYYQDNDENPIQLFRDSVGEGDDELEKDAYRRTGWFLSVRDDKVDGFSASDIAAQTDYFSQRCLIEIIRPKKNTDTPLYYEVGQQRPIVTTSEGVRTHGGDRSNTAAVTFGALPVSETTFWSSYRLYRGDRVVGDGLSSDGYVIVDSVLPQGFGYIYSVIGQVTVPQNPVSVLVNVSTGGGTQSILPGVITLSEGDVYLRLREQLTNPEGEYNVGVSTFSFDAGDPENQQYRNFLIESESVSDFFDSKATSIGRPHVEDTEQVQLTRSSSVTYSDPFALDSSRLSLSSFNPMFFPYKDYPTKYGQVTYLLDGGEVAYVMQEKRCGIQPISRTLIESSGDGQLVTSTNVMGTESYYAGMYGPGRNPESVVSRFGKTYFADVEAGRVIELSRDGVQPISDNKMSSYFKRVFAAAIDTETSPRIPSGIDPDNDEYLVTILQLTTNNIVINDGADDEEVIGTVATPTSDTLTYNDGVVTPVFEDSGITTWGKDQSRWEDATLNDITWGTKGCGTVVLDRLNERDGVHISFSERDSDANVTVDVVTSDLRFIGLATVSLSDWSIDIPSVIVEVGDLVTDDVDEAVVVEENTSSALTTISYSTTKEFWLTRYSFTPELYANIHNRFLSFFNGQLYLHDSNDVRNNFYGTQYNSTATLVSKADPSMVKVYNALSLEGNDTWAATVSNSEQTTDITEAMYQEREGMYYSVIPNDATEDSVNNTSHKIVLGEVESVTGQVFNIVKFTSRISNLPFGIGDSIYALQDDQDQTLGVTVTEIIDRKTIRVSGTLTGQVGNTLMAVSSNVINGDKLRDYYAQIQLTNDSTGRVELFAVNANYTPSPFHNDQSQKQ